MKIKTLLLNLILIFGFQAVLQAQNNDVKNDSVAIHQLILTLFDGMREGDSAKVASVFKRDVSMYTSYTDNQGIKKIKKGSLTQFLKAIGTPHEEIYDEKIWNTKIQIDAGIAQVWTDYSFFLGNKFSHCGVDTFHLIRDTEKGWLIVNLMDTRRKEGCQSMKP